MSGEVVIAITAIKGVGALIIGECVVASTAIEGVITEVAGEVVIAITAIDGVGTGLAINGVVTSEAGDGVMAKATNRLVELSVPWMTSPAAADPSGGKLGLKLSVRIWLAVVLFRTAKVSI